MEIKLMLLDEKCMPYKKHETDSGFDLKARIPSLVSLGQFQILKIPVGIVAEPPEGYELQIRPRSGLALKGVVAELGTIDNSYRGEISVIMTNNSSTPFHINPYDRIAQMVLQKIETPTLKVVKELNNTDRGQSGFGSTGL